MFKRVPIPTPQKYTTMTCLSNVIIGDPLCMRPAIKEDPYNASFTRHTHPNRAFTDYLLRCQRAAISCKILKAKSRNGHRVSRGKCSRGNRQKDDQFGMHTHANKQAHVNPEGATNDVRTMSCAIQHTWSGDMAGFLPSL